ncbi:MAG: hypothetical protein ACK5DG_06865 [Chitinophagaceae bacterium]|jgi:hypothetical protein
MKSTLTLYRILSYILLFIAIISSFNVLAALLVALANPSLLLQVFLSAAIVLYSFSSFVFLKKCVEAKRNQKNGLKDFIKANAYITAFLAILMTIAGAAAILSPNLLKKASEMMPTMPGSNEISKSDLPTLLKRLVWFMLIYGLILLIHIQITFRLLKQYAHLFGQKADDNNSSF